MMPLIELCKILVLAFKIHAKLINLSADQLKVIPYAAPIKNLKIVLTILFSFLGVMQ